jgi:hypothetical protein
MCVYMCVYIYIYIYIYTYNGKFLAILGAPYIYDISRLRVNITTCCANILLSKSVAASYLCDQLFNIRLCILF